MASKKGSQLPVASSVADIDSVIIVTATTPTTKKASKSVLLDGLATDAELTAGLATKANTVHTHTAANVTDFDTEVSNNTDVAANTTNRHTHSNKPVLDATTASFTTTDETKLDGVATGATANSSDAQLRDRSTHTGTQTAATISDFSTAADARITTQKGQNSGIATLDSGGKVPSVQLPSFVDDVLEFANTAAFPATGSAEVIYVALDTNRVYRWGGSSYAEISPSPGSTDAVPEGSTNKYFTDDRVESNAEVAANTAARHSHSNKTLLDTYDQTNANLADAVTKKHAHANQVVLDATTASFLIADETKLDGVATGATANDTDANLKNRANHTGTQAISTVTGLQTAIDGKQFKSFRTIGTADSDYLTDGTADEVQFNTAISDIYAAGGGTLYVKPGTYQFAAQLTLKSGVNLVGSGLGLSILTIAAGFSGGIMARENTGAADNIEVTGLTFDAAGKVDVGLLHIYQGDNVNVHHNEFKNQGYSASSKWATRLGNYNDADPSGSQSHNVRFCNNVLDSNNCGTFEQLLFVNQAESYVQNNVFRNNTNAQAYELMLYINGNGVDCSGNAFDSPSAHSIGIMESTVVNVHHNTFHYDANFNCVTIINSAQVKVENNLANNTLAGNTSGFVTFFDRAFGPDGFTQLVGDTQDVSVRHNSVSGMKYFATAQIGGTVLGTDYTMEQTGLVFEANEIRNSLSVPFVLGVDNVANLMKKVYIRNNNVYSWVGASSGAIQFRGYTSDVTQMSEIYISGNFVASPTDGSANGAVRVIGCTVAEISNNKFTGVTNPITTATGGVVTRQFNNLGSTTSQLPGLDAQSNKITNVTDPTAAQDAATKNYIDMAATPDATGSVNGKVRLTGDLGGTASAPTTPTAVHITGTETIGGAKTFSVSPIITNTAPGVFLTETDQTSPAGVYRIDVSGDLLRFIRSSTVIAALNAAGLAVTGTVTSTGTVNGRTMSTDGTKLDGIATGATANSSDATLLARANHTGTQSADSLTDGTTNKAFLATERTKLAGVATGATANDTDSNLKSRANHTGAQLLSTISDITTSAAELNVLDGITASGTELNYTDGVTSAIQAQIDGKAPTTHSHAESDITNLVTDLAAKAPLSSPTFTGTVTMPAPSGSTDAATKGYVDENIGSALIDSTRKRPFLFSDFLATGAATCDPFLGVATGSGTVNNPNLSLAHHPGIVRLRSSATSNSGFLIGTNSVMLVLGGSEVFESVFRLETLSLSTFRIGFHNSSTSADAANGAYLEVDSSGVATGKTAATSTRSSTSTTTTLTAATWYRIRIAVNAAATSVAYSIFTADGTLVWTDFLTTNIPTGNTGAGFIGTSSGSSAIDLAHLDYMALSWGSDRVR